MSTQDPQAAGGEDEVRRFNSVQDVENFIFQLPQASLNDCIGGSHRKAADIQNQFWDALDGYDDTEPIGTIRKVILRRKQVYVLERDLGGIFLLKIVKGSGPNNTLQYRGWLREGGFTQKPHVFGIKHDNVSTAKKGPDLGTEQPVASLKRKRKDPEMTEDSTETYIDAEAGAGKISKKARPGPPRKNAKKTAPQTEKPSPLSKQKRGQEEAEESTETPNDVEANETEVSDKTDPSNRPGPQSKKSKRPKLALKRKRENEEVSVGTRKIRDSSTGDILGVLSRTPTTLKIRFPTNKSKILSAEPEQSTSSSDRTQNAGDTAGYSTETRNVAEPGAADGSEGVVPKRRPGRPRKGSKKSTPAPKKPTTPSKKKKQGNGEDGRRIVGGVHVPEGTTPTQSSRSQLRSSKVSTSEANDPTLVSILTRNGGDEVEKIKEAKMAAREAAVQAAVAPINNLSDFLLPTSGGPNKPAEDINEAIHSAQSKLEELRGVRHREESEDIPGDWLEYEKLAYEAACANDHLEKPPNTRGRRGPGRPPKLHKSSTSGPIVQRPNTNAGLNAYQKPAWTDVEAVRDLEAKGFLNKIVPNIADIVAPNRPYKKLKAGANTPTTPKTPKSANTPRTADDPQATRKSRRSRGQLPETGGIKSADRNIGARGKSRASKTKGAKGSASHVPRGSLEHDYPIPKGSLRKDNTKGQNGKGDRQYSLVRMEIQPRDQKLIGHDFNGNERFEKIEGKEYRYSRDAEGNEIVYIGGVPVKKDTAEDHATENGAEVQNSVEVEAVAVTENGAEAENNEQVANEEALENIEVENEDVVEEEVETEGEEAEHGAEFQKRVESQEL